MRVYKVYKHPKKDTYEAIKIGFAWPPFLCSFLIFPFGLLWLLDRRLYLISILYAIPYLFLNALNSEIRVLVNEVSIKVYLLILCIYFLPWLLVGFKGNQWSHNNFKKKGYPLIQTVKARTTKSAIALAKNEEHTSEFDSEESYQAVNLTKKEIKRAKKEKKRAEKEAQNKKEMIGFVKLIVVGGAIILFVNWLDFVDIISVSEIINYF